MYLILYTVTEKNKEEYCIICIFYIKGKLYIHIQIFMKYASPVTAFIIYFFPSFFFFITDPSWNHKGESSDQVKTRLCIKRLRITHLQGNVFVHNN